MFSFLYELLIALTITYFFYVKEKPSIKYLFYGYGLFFVSLTLQFPFYYLSGYFNSINFNILPIIILTGAIVISELTKYLSLKRFVKTKSIKNGILFGIGWVTIESISIFSIFYYNYISKFLPFQLDLVYLDSNLQIVFSNFIFFFIANLAITILVIFSIVKRKKIYLFLAMIFSFLILVVFKYLTNLNLTIFSILILTISLIIIFKYKFILIK